MQLFDREGMSQATGLSKTKINLLLRLIKGPKMERTYAQLDIKEGVEMIDSMLKHFNITLDYDAEALRKAIPTSGPFITVSNHPFGFWDGVIVLLLVARLRPGFRAVANFLLSFFAPIKDLFLTVNPFEKSGPKGMGGKAKVLNQLEQGLGVALFPAGEVATWYKGQTSIQDRPWSLRSMELLQTAQVPVIPIYFHGRNSWMFHLLGKIHPLLRTLRIPTELYKKKNSTIKMSIGERLEWSSLSDYDTPEALRDFLQAHTLSLGKKLY